MKQKGLIKLKKCIGLTRKPKKGVFVAKRNYYDAGKEPDPDLEEMVKKGYALVHHGKSGHWYAVSDEGLRTMEVVLDIKIVRV